MSNYTISDLINLDQIKEISGDDVEMEIELLQLYFEDTYARLATIQNEIFHNNITSIKTELHHLKGSSGNIGAKKIAEIVVNLEHSCQDASSDQILGTVQDIHDYLAQMKALLIQHYHQEL